MRGRKEDLKICVMLWDKCRHFKSHYIYPSQETWRKWLRNQGALDVSRRTLNRYFRSAQNRMQINRIRRVKHDPIKGMMFLTTLYALSYTGLLLLYYNGIIEWKELKAYLKNSKNFKARQSKKKKKGLGPGNGGYYKDFTSSGDPQKVPG